MAPRESAVSTNLPVHRRGSVHSLGEEVPRGFIDVVTTPRQPRPGPSESGRRELADWVVSPDNPLARRVFVNRVWLWVMGRGLVRTPDNFGTTGEPPTHPELLDALASAFGGTAEGGSRFPGIRPWSSKSLIREIVLARAYRMGSEPSDAARDLDPENRRWSHAVRKRLTAEQLRDAMLAVGGRLCTEPPVGPTFPGDRTSDFGFVDAAPHRSVYVPVFRNALPEIFRVFDFPPASLVTGMRDESVVATQALYLTNDAFVEEQADAVRDRLRALTNDRGTDGAGSGGPSDAADVRAVDWLWRAATGRRPTPGEARAVLRYVASAGDVSRAWSEATQAVFASPDFRILR